VSSDSSAVQGDGDSYIPSISGDGRYVAFHSTASNLVSGDTNGGVDVFVKDLASGVTTRVSTDSSAVQGNGISETASISGDGRYVAFLSYASNLVSGDSNGASDIFVKDMASGVTTRVSTDKSAVQGNGYSYTPSMSEDGRSVAFESYASNLHPADMTYAGDVFRVTNPLANHPTGIALANSSVQENSNSGTLVGTLSTTDPDAVDTFTYTLLDSAGGRFRIAGAQVLVDHGTLLDFEGAASHTIRVRTTDQAGARYDQDFAIAITDINEEPTQLTISASSMPENASSGTLVGVLSTTDPDAGDAFTYTLADSDGGRFKLVGEQLLVDDGTLLDFEGAASHTIRVRTTDQRGGGLSYEQDLLITITNVNEAPTHIELSGNSVPENSSSDTLVGTLSTTDPDADDTFTYALVDNAGGRFKIDRDQVLADNGSLLDFETATSYTIRVRTTDQAGTGLSYEQDLVITVTDVHDFASPALFDPTSSFFRLRCSNTSGAADYTFGYGEAGGGWIVLTGDWNGDGQKGVGLYDPEASTFYLTNAYQTGFAEYTFGYGEPGGGWIPLVGDWNGDGSAGVGLYDPKSSTFYLTDTLESGFAHYTFGYGEPGGGWTPLVGDWNGDGHTGVGLYNPQASTFYLTNALTSGYAEHTFGFGEPGGGWTPLVGDWDGDGAAGVGLFATQSSTFYLTNAFVSGFAQYAFGYGEPGAGWTPLVADWNGNGADGVGLYAPSSSTFYLTDTLTSGYAEYTVGFGQPGAGWQPLVGNWGAAPTVATTALSAEAVDQIHLGDLARDPTATDLDISLIGD
jgi:hypothetical protein